LIVLQLDRDALIGQTNCSQLLKPQDVFRREALEILFDGLFIDFEPMLKRGMKEKIVIGDGRASPSGVIAASRVQGVAFKEIQQAERLKQR